MTSNPIVKTIDVHQLKFLYDNSTNLCLIDVRELDEWQAIHIPNAIHIPKDDINDIITHIPDLTQPIYLHCKSGVRSLYAAQKLLAIGYEHVYSVDRGIMAWSQCHYPTSFKEKSNA